MTKSEPNCSDANWVLSKNSAPVVELKVNLSSVGVDPIALIWTLSPSRDLKSVMLSIPMGGLRKTKVKSNISALKPPVRVSLPSPPLRVSKPATPSKRSLPSSPLRMSLPNAPERISLSAAPKSWSSPSPPMRVSVPSPPSRVSLPPPLPLRKLLSLLPVMLSSLSVPITFLPYRWWEDWGLPGTCYLYPYVTAATSPRYQLHRCQRSNALYPALTHSRPTRTRCGGNLRSRVGKAEIWNEVGNLGVWNWAVGRTGGDS